MMQSEYDIAIVGSGFGGSLLATVARRLGLTVLLLEKGRHPRFAIGESTSPLANLLLEELARRYDLPRLAPLTSYGPWQRTYPELGCGLKRGFSYYGHQAGQRYRTDSERTNQLLVAASPHDEVADTHWFRADVDAFFVREAVAAGADYRDRVTLEPPQWEPSGPARLTGGSPEGEIDARARLVVDATGPRGYLSRALGLAETDFPDYPGTQALYSHFTGVRRCDGMAEFCPDDTPPYPPDDAALHHVFDGGWMWVLRVGHGVTSAGFAVTEALAAEVGLAQGEPAWGRLLARFPSVAAQFAGAEPVQPFVYAPRLAYRAAQAVGPGWALLPSAAAFVDPLFSTGIPLTLLGVERLGRILEDRWGGDGFDDALTEYGAVTLAEADATADFIGACYAAMPHFETFADLSMFYFAAASYSEMARRLSRPHFAPGFLLSRHPTFGPALRHATAQVRACPASGRSFAAAIEDVNVAGLCDPQKRHWYGVDLEDVVQGATKLGLTPPEMRDVLRHAPWAQPNCL